ncbi:hypothetical protein [Oceanospirillum sanctuarii]|nr:hypothetical protein [Oceanospirillum sanctuarii]
MTLKLSGGYAMATTEGDVDIILSGLVSHLVRNLLNPLKVLIRVVPVSY